MSGKERLVYTPTANVCLNCPPEAFLFIVALGPTAWWCGGVWLGEIGEVTSKRIRGLT
jgi:hypothetical protein